MNKRNKILIIGFGSIGQRHYYNLKKLGQKEVYVFDIKKNQIPKNIKQVGKLDFKTLSLFKIVFVCNPTNLHIKTAIMAAKAGCHLFIEKPLSNNLKDIKKLIKIGEQKKLTTMTACNLRFEPCLKKIKELVDKNFIGKIYLVYLSYGRFLPHQRKRADYRKIYAANKKMGGGIILDDIHDFDLLFWFDNFRKPRKVVLVSEKLTDLKIDVEDIFNATIVFENKVLGNIRGDYISKYKHRTCQIIGEKGNLFWNFRKNEVWFDYFENGKEKKKMMFYKKSNQNIQYIDEIKYFLDCVDKRKKTFNDLERSFFILKQVLKTK